LIQACLTDRKGAERAYKPELFTEFGQQVG